ncbi:hypothetical protein CWRG_00261 [Chthonomonas calidirosea]|uniref:hypothetical protein n=1 Tax=Chthonomonas calidirosea TaxID=454171 RepID=UPI0006DD46C0|nr:hypothetical protein [Chthonomonas calidirosea]CEK12905.1 hypothetical protein CWRG_00261 [Chthonomonas calidirosea]
MVFKPSSVSWPITAKRPIERLSSITPLQRRRYAILLACTILLLGLLPLILFSMWRLSLQQNTLLTPFRKLIAMHPGEKYYWASPNELVVCKNSIQIGTTARQLILTSVNYTSTDATYALAAKGSVLLGSLVVHTSSLSPSIFSAQSPSYDDWPRMFYKVPGKNAVSFYYI